MKTLDRCIELLSDSYKYMLMAREPLFEFSWQQMEDMWAPFVTDNVLKETMSYVSGPVIYKLHESYTSSFKAMLNNLFIKQKIVKNILAGLPE